jgi:type IX secretion system PorP/SprF family membrane protein
MNVMAQLPINDLYQYQYSLINPAFVGVDGQKISFAARMLVTDGLIHTTGAVAGYETQLKKVNSGLGFNLRAATLGPESSSFLNLSYNYQWKINEKSKLVFGLKASSYKYVMDYSRYVPIDPDDPLITGLGVGTSANLLAGAGILFRYDKFFAAISSDNILFSRSRGDVSFDSNLGKKLFHYTVGADVKINDRLSSSHSIYAASVGDVWRTDLNTSFTFDWAILGASLETATGFERVYPKINCGVKLKDNGRILVILYSGVDNVPKDFSAQLAMQFDL